MGVRETASRGSRRFTLSRKRTCQRASSTRSLPTCVAVRRHAARKPHDLATDRSRWMHLRTAMKGLADQVVPREGSDRRRTKADPGRARSDIRRRSREGASSRCEDSRVRECDLITCRVASPPRCRAIDILCADDDVERSTNVSAAERTTRESALASGAKGEGVPGRGSSASFTRCEAIRSWLDCGS